MKQLNFTVVLIIAMLILLSETLFAQWNNESIDNYSIYDQFANRKEVGNRDILSNPEKPSQYRTLNKGTQVQMTGWIPTNGPYGGPVKSFARIFESGPQGANYIFAGTWGEISVGNNGGRIFRSQDGENWTALNNFSTYTGSSITSIASVPTSPSGFILYASSDYGWLGSLISGVFRSTNYGDTWVPINSGLINADISSLAVNGTTIFAGNYWGGVFRSTNLGDNWTLLPGLTDAVITLIVDGTNIIAGTNSGVFISTNNGDNWSSAGLTGFRIESFAINGSYIFAGTNNNGLFRSSNYGIEWFPVNNGLASNDVPSLAVDGTDIYAANYSGGVYLSTNFGNTWTAINNGLITPDDYTTVGSLLFDNSNGNLYAGSIGDGIFRLTTNSTEWSRVNSGLTNTTILSIATKSSGNESYLFAGCKNSLGRGVFRSTNNGGDWVPMNNGLPHFREIYDLMYKDDFLFAGAALNGVFRSTDNGASWISSGLTGLNVTCFAFNEEYLFAGHAMPSDGGIRRSTDNGSSWTSTGLTGVEVSDLAINGDNLFASTIWNGVLKSTDNGVSWSTVFLPGYLTLSLAVIGTDIFVGTVYGVLRSTDNGANWIPVNNGLPATDIYEMAVYENNLFAATLYGVYLSTDFGSSWSNVDTDLENYSVSSLGILDGYLYAATVPGSIWRRPLSDMVVHVELISCVTPSAFSLEQNYPNPFNPSTTIRYSIPYYEFVTFKVYNVLGIEVATLVNEEKSTGSYEIEFNAAGLSSGIYFYKLQAGSFTETKKMILMK